MKKAVKKASSFVGLEIGDIEGKQQLDETMDDEDAMTRELYSRVHTQSQLLQNQMTMNLIDQI